MDLGRARDREPSFSEVQGGWRRGKWTARKNFRSRSSSRAAATTRTRVAKAIKIADLTGATRNDDPDGRVWISQPDGANVHARIFVHYGGVVMGVAVLSDASKLDGMKAAFETLTIAQ